MPTPIPPVLSPFIGPPASGSLTLITSVLDTTSNWLLLRYIYAALCPEKRNGHVTRGTGVMGGIGENTADDKNEDLRVILISFLRPFEIWREMAKKIGLDLPSLLSSSGSDQPRLLYIDALTQLSLPPTTPGARLSSAKRPHPQIHALPPFTNLSALESQLSQFLAATTASSRCNNNDDDDPTSYHLLAIDGLDLLLALAGPEAGVSPTALSSFLLHLRSSLPVRNSSTVLTLSADAPLLHNASSADATPLELSHRQFLTITAHQAERVVQLRGLDTGAARDVSGVLRISNGGAAGAGAGAAAGGDGDETIDQGKRVGEGGEEGEEQEKSGSDNNILDRQQKDVEAGGREWLYQVRGDGSVRVWARGE